ncbi:CLUMA_CG006646, isoform A [Clunio marinus]|uniref:CLUMA_CG006646, isoform A n=1 Tax=Clunio marinus TaxID=568069 RepID=A0A1J1HYK2_9DIPT|nr:CLUMA_CG006646, isoform A [Clunio marinus]
MLLLHMKRYLKKFISVVFVELSNSLPRKNNKFFKAEIKRRKQEVIDTSQKEIRYLIFLHDIEIQELSLSIYS